MTYLCDEHFLAKFPTKIFARISLLADDYEPAFASHRQRLAGGKRRVSVAGRLPGIVAEAVRHPDQGGDPEDEDGQEREQPAAVIRLRQESVPQHEVRADEEGIEQGHQENGCFGAHQAAQAGLLQRDAQGTVAQVEVRHQI